MKPMLAGQYVPDKIRLPIYGQPKLDGIRMFVQNRTALTRSLKPVRSQWVQQFIQQHPELEGLDGELIAGDPTADDVFRRTTSAVMSYDKPDEVKFYVFDDWAHGGTFVDRLDSIRHRWSDGLLPDFCVIVETTLIQTVDEISRYEAEILAQKYEGVILRDPLGKYRHGRSSPKSGELIKLKQFIDTEARVTGFVELMHNGNEAEINALGYMERSSHSENLVPMGVLGALMAEGRFPDGRRYKVRIGSGFDMNLRKEIWDNQIDYLGKMAKFKYFAAGSKDAPRFPIFLGFRDADDMDPISESNPKLTQGELF